MVMVELRSFSSDLALHVEDCEMIGEDFRLHPLFQLFRQIVPVASVWSRLVLASRLLYHSKRIIRSCYQASCASDVAVSVSFQFALPVAVLPTTRKLLEPVVSIEEAV